MKRNYFLLSFQYVDYCAGVSECLVLYVLILRFLTLVVPIHFVGVLVLTTAWERSMIK